MRRLRGVSTVASRLRVRSVNLREGSRPPRNCRAAPHVLVGACEVADEGNLTSLLGEGVDMGVGEAGCRFRSVDISFFQSAYRVDWIASREGGKAFQSGSSGSESSSHCPRPARSVKDYFHFL
jgi:hypothetical protein